MTYKEMAEERISTFARTEDDFSPWVFVTSSGKRFVSNHIKTNAEQIYEEAVQEELNWLNQEETY